MKTNTAVLVLILFFSVLLVSCNDHFQTWKEFNSDFLSKTSVQEKMNTSSSGLRSKVFFQGIGPKPKSNSIVKVRYMAKFSDGTICNFIDSVNYVYNYPGGIQEALLQMNRESVWQLCLPYDLAFGKSGRTNSYGNYEIPPYTTIFISKFELLEVINY